MCSRMGLTLAIFFFGYIFSGCLAQYPYQTLRQHLLKDYDKFARPVYKSSEGITIETNLSPLYLSALDEENAMMTVEGWVFFKWKDMFLRWDPSEYAGITSFSIPNTEVWKPDLTLYNSKPTKNVVELMNAKTNVIISNDGTVLWVPPVTLSSFCIIDRNSDIQRCNLTIGSWTENINHIDLQFDKKKVDRKYLSNTNPKWRIEHIDAIREEKIYECCVEAYVSVVFIFELKRIESSHPSSHVKEVVCASVVVAIIMALAMFWLPADSDKKFTLGALSVFILTMLLHISSLSNYATQIIGSFTKIPLFVVAVAILIEIIIVNIARMKSPCKAPSILVTGVIPQVLLLNPKPADSATQNQDVEKSKNASHVLESKSSSHDWYLIATAVDRILFVAFLLVFIIERSI